MLLSTAVKNIKRYSHRGDPAVTTDQITTDIVAACSDARRDIIARLPKRFLHKKATTAITTVYTPAAQVVYSLASDVQDPIVFWFTHNSAEYVLKKVMSDKEWFNHVYSTTTSADKPYCYREIGLDSSGYKQIEIFPAPDAAYTINYEYYKVPSAELAVSDINSQIPDIPEANSDALWKGGLYYYLKAFDDPAQVAAKADYDASLIKSDVSEDMDSDVNLAWRWNVWSKEHYDDLGNRIR